MHVTRLWTVGLLVVVAAGAATSIARGDEKRPPEVEPALELVIEAGGRKVDARFDVPVEIEVGGKAVSIVVRQRPERTFSAHGLTFRYPALMGFEYDGSDPSSPSWTLDGNSAIVILTRTEDRGEPAAILDGVVKNMLAAYKVKAEVTATSMRFAGAEHPARRIRADMGAVLHQDIAVVPHGSARWIVIAQDTPAADGSATAESVRVRALLDSTWTLAK
jgi:hypothetical protein